MAHVEMLDRRWVVRLDEVGPVLWMYDRETGDPIEAFQPDWDGGATWEAVLGLDEFGAMPAPRVPCTVCGEDPCVLTPPPVPATSPRPPAPPLWWALNDAVSALVRAGAPQGDILDEIDVILERRR